MTTKSREEIIHDIKTHIKKCGGEPNSWNLGISNDAASELFKIIKIDKDKDRWIYRIVNDYESAKNILELFLKEGYKGEVKDKSKLLGENIYVYGFKSPETTSL